DSVTEGTQAPFGHQEIALPRQDEGRHADLFQAAFHIELLYQAKPVGHDALIGLPALSSDKLKKRPRLLPAAEEQVEELVDKGTVGRQGITGEHQAGDTLQQAALEARADPL